MDKKGKVLTQLFCKSLEIEHVAFKTRLLLQYQLKSTLKRHNKSLLDYCTILSVNVMNVYNPLLERLIITCEVFHCVNALISEMLSNISVWQEGLTVKWKTVWFLTCVKSVMVMTNLITVY